jgi:hypothetical protein
MDSPRVHELLYFTRNPRLILPRHLGHRKKRKPKNKKKKKEKKKQKKKKKEEREGMMIGYLHRYNSFTIPFHMRYDCMQLSYNFCTILTIFFNINYWIFRIHM